jgi:hypothetical protein
MSVLELPTPVGAVTPVEPDDVRPTGRSDTRRSSSPGDLPEADTHASGQTADIAAGLGVPARAVATAHQMLWRHFAGAGDGNGIRLTAVLEGIRAARLNAPALLVRGRGQEFRVGVVLLADPLVVLIVGGAQQVMHWSLLPGGPSVTARADGLRFLRGLAIGGRLSFEGEGLRLPPIEFDGGPWKDEDEWRLFEDLAVLEEWGGVTLPMPTIVSAHEATIAAQAASWGRTRLVEAHISDVITFAAPEVGSETPDELRLHQRFSVELLGEEIPMGDGLARVELRDIERQTGTPAASMVQYTARPAESNLTFLLTPPVTRLKPPRRTQQDEISPPQAPMPTERLRMLIPERRPAVRRLSEVLPNRRMHRVGHQGGTAGLLDDLRG